MADFLYKHTLLNPLEDALQKHDPRSEFILPIGWNWFRFPKHDDPATIDIFEPLYGLRPWFGGLQDHGEVYAGHQPAGCAECGGTDPIHADGEPILWCGHLDPGNADYDPLHTPETDGFHNWRGDESKLILVGSGTLFDGTTRWTGSVTETDLEDGSGRCLVTALVECVNHPLWLFSTADLMGGPGSGCAPFRLGATPGPGCNTVDPGGWNPDPLVGGVDGVMEYRTRVEIIIPEPGARIPNELTVNVKQFCYSASSIHEEIDLGGGVMVPGYETVSYNFKGIGRGPHRDDGNERVVRFQRRGRHGVDGMGAAGYRDGYILEVLDSHEDLRPRVRSRYYTNLSGTGA